MTSEISISTEIYDSIFRAKEILDKEYQDAFDWITDITKNPNRPKRNECEICGHSHKKLELHHVRGNKHGNETITVCHECHDTLTVNQRLWDRSWLDPNAENKYAFFERGLIDIFELKYKKTDKEIFKLIAEELKRGFSYD
jgi:DNA-directed RNA polymerase subunit M/transcription elongation factor TFIIS